MLKLIRGEVLHFLSGPYDEAGAHASVGSYQYFDDGGLLIDDGNIAFCGSWADAQRLAPWRGLRMSAGKVMMDRHCPAFLHDTPQSS